MVTDRLGNKTRPGKPEGYGQHRTISEIAAYVGFAPRTVERWAKAGRIPEPDHVTTAGWKLWSPEQCRRILAWVRNGRRGTA